MVTSPPRPVLRPVLPPVLRSALDLVLGAGCAGCGAQDGPACPHCLALLAPPLPVRPDPCPPELPPVHAAGTYAGAVRDLLLAHKEHARLALAGPLGRALAGALAAALSGVPGAGPGASARLVLVTVPSRPGSARRRGHDPLLRLGRVAAAHLRAAGADVELAPVLRLRRRVLDQAGLGAGERRANLRGALVVPDALRVLLAGATVLLVDDVLTTGATLAESARALAAAGAPPAAAAVLAATPRRGGTTAAGARHDSSSVPTTTNVGRPSRAGPRAPRPVAARAGS